MIIKSTRIPTAHAFRIASYLTEPADNETATWHRGCRKDLLVMGEISRIAGKQYAIRHFVISPCGAMCQQDFTAVLAEICFEYGVSITSGNRSSIVEHLKPRATGSENEVHWHVAIPEFDVETGKILSSSFYKMRNEKISRICELKLGHRIVPGRFNKQVYLTLQKERRQLDLTPFEASLRAAAIEASGSEDNWLEYRAKQNRNRHAQAIS
ncbi:hypothetical protein ACFE33_15785 (plasmid) [Falsihalocynthiibacter sp. SS001]|uniref:hypothetical protein n=1 Tax=Falsihalocynthiibacter sp. SS001 TaxID=3349698 RepID=UPI0036D28B1A